MKRTKMGDAACPVARALDVIGDWWTLLIVRDAFDGLRRFGEFQQSLGISKGILAGRLKELVQAGILETAPAPDGRVHHDYVLTAKGRDLFAVVVGVRQWGEAHCFAPGEARSRLIDKRTGGDVGRLQVQSVSGAALAASDTEVRKVEEHTKVPHA